MKFGSDINMIFFVKPKIKTKPLGLKTKTKTLFFVLVTLVSRTTSLPGVGLNPHQLTVSDF